MGERARERERNTHPNDKPDRRLCLPVLLSTPSRSCVCHYYCATHSKSLCKEATFNLEEKKNAQTYTLNHSLSPIHQNGSGAGHSVAGWPCAKPYFRVIASKRSSQAKTTRAANNDKPGDSGAILSAVYSRLHHSR